MGERLAVVFSWWEGDINAIADRRIDGLDQNWGCQLKAMRERGGDMTGILE